MQTIYRTAPTSNFTIYANDLINSSIPPTPKAVLIYLLSKPSSWQLKTHDLRKQLGLTAYAVKKALKWLQIVGYVYYKRYFGGFTKWFVFDKPQTAHSPTISTQVEKTHVLIQPVLVRTETEERKKPLPAPLEIHTENQEQENIVVVDGLVFPEKLTPVQKKAAKHIIKKVKQPELQQPVLFALAYAMAQNKVKSAPAYLQGLVTRANNGTFETIQPTTATNQGGKPLIPIWQGYGQSSPSKPEVASGFIQQARAALRGIAK
jgi:hypothetical protein